MQESTVFSSYLAGKIAEFKFDEFYTKRNQILLHIGMWLGFSVLLLVSYVLAYHLSVFNSLILTLRMAAVNMLVFYMFFYLLVPGIFSGSKRSMIFLLLVFPVIIFIWIAVTYFISILYHALGVEITTGELQGAIGKSANQTFPEAVSVRRMLSQTIIIISILSPFFFVKILFEISKLYNRTLNIQQQKAALEIQNINIEKKFLKAQLNPHFLFNILNNLYSLSIKKDASAPNVILNLSDIMSYTLYESNTEKVTLEKELEFIKNYIELERMRYPLDKNIRIHIPEGKAISGFYMAPLLTFTFIENAFKYGLRNSKEQWIYLNIKVVDKVLYFQLENDAEQGKGDSTPTNPDGSNWVIIKV